MRISRLIPFLLKHRTPQIPGVRGAWEEYGGVFLENYVDESAPRSFPCIDASASTGQPAWLARWGSFGVASAALAGSLALTGCGANLQNAGTGEPVVSTRAIAGQVHGGVFPIQNATVRLMQTVTGNSSGYGSTATTLGTATTDANGNFNFSQTYTCSASTEFAYITVTGGHSSNLAGTATNSSIVQVGVIGGCATLAADYSTIQVNVSEASTVAAAYALGNFITINANTGAGAGQQIVNIGAPQRNAYGSPGCNGTGSNMICNAAGLGHAFQNAYNLVDQVSLTTGALPSGAARSANPSATAVPGVVPQQMINTLANILQNCVDSLSSSTYCSTLFNYATPPGGTAPANTLQAAMNMAKYPTNNISNLYGLQSRTPYFTPDLDAAPTSFTVSIFYGINAAGNATTFAYPVDLALDASDNVFLLYGSGAPGANTATAVAELYPSGASAGYVSNGKYGYPSQIAVDTNGNVYTTNNDGTTGVVLHLQNGGALSPVATLANASGVAVDLNNNLWISAASTTSRSLNQYKYANIHASTGSATADFFTGAIGNIPGIAIDGIGGVWGVLNVSGGNSSAVNLYNSGSVNAPSYSATGYNTIGFGAGNGFSISLVPTSTTIAGGYFPLNGQLASAGTYIPNGNQLYTGPVATTTGSAAPNRNTMDGAGNIFWSDNESGGLLWIYTPSNNPVQTAGTSVSLLPCYPVPDGSSFTCLTGANLGATYLRGMAVDSAGSVWMGADAGLGTFVEIIGLGTPTWPQLSYANPGSKPQ